MIQSAISCRGATRDVVHDHFRERVNVRRRGAVRFATGLAWPRRRSRRTRRRSTRVLFGRAKCKQPAEAFHVVVHLRELIVHRRVGDRGQMKNRVELLVAELLPPIERGQILRDEIAFVAGEILEIARAEIVDHGQPRVREISPAGRG